MRQSSLPGITYIIQHYLHWHKVFVL